jgi:8-amino-7-oxononanoate synthase
VVESLFSMEGDLAPLAELANLAERYDAELIVDEAHAVGVFGPQGRGLVAEAGLAGRVLASIFTCGKALASSGAFVCGSETLRSFLINRARTFIFSTALPPYFAEHVRAGVELASRADAQRVRVISLAHFLRAELRRHGLDVAAGSSPIVPVILGDNERAMRVAQRLRGAGFGVRAIRPPTVPQGTARLRLSITARHTESVLGELAAAIASAASQSSRAASAMPAANRAAL